MTLDKRFISTRFPRSSQYNPEWILASVSGGANSLWLTEWLANALNLQPGMRVFGHRLWAGGVVNLPAA